MLNSRWRDGHRRRNLAAFGKMIVATIALAFGERAYGQFGDYSLDPLSPEVPGLSPAAILVTPPPFVAPAVVIPPAGLNLLPAENLTSFSYGLDHSVFPDTKQSRVHVRYSVTRPTMGAPGSVVAVQAAGNGAAGDEFQLTLMGLPPMPIAGTPILYVDATGLALTPLPPVQSDIDGLDIRENVVFGGGVFQYPVYYCVDAAAAARLSGLMGVPVTVSTILFTAGGPGLPAVYATPAMLGLVPGDVIDALAVQDNGAQGVLGAGDIVYISLAPGSPSAVAPLALGTASVIEAFPSNPPVVQIPPAWLGLLASDDVDAISLYDPGECGIPLPPCTGDVFPAIGDGMVNIDDLLIVIIHWGQTGPPRPPGDCAPGIIGNCTVNIDDLLAVITTWGPCP